MSKALFILNDPPYGTERSHNGLRLAGSLAKRDGEQVKVFLIGDACSRAKRGQKVPKGYYNIETMLKAVSRCTEGESVSAGPVWMPEASLTRTSPKGASAAVWTNSRPGRSGPRDVDRGPSRPPERRPARSHR